LKVNLEELLTTQDMADLLNICRIRVLQLIYSGEIKAIKIGGIWLARKEDVLAAKARNKKEGWPKGKKRGKQSPAHIKKALRSRMRALRRDRRMKKMVEERLEEEWL
jgi:excisionase family DNA binding protein